MIVTSSQSILWTYVSIIHKIYFEKQSKIIDPVPSRIADDSDRGPQEAISKLLLNLMGHKVALDLRSKTGNGDIASELSTLFRRVRNGDFSYEHYRALSRLVIKQAPDVDIWNAVLNLIITVARTTPPTSIPVSLDGTPITISTLSFQGTE